MMMVFHLEHSNLHLDPGTTDVYIVVMHPQHNIYLNKISFRKPVTKIKQIPFLFLCHGTIWLSSAQ